MTASARNRSSTASKANSATSARCNEELFLRFKNGCLEFDDLRTLSKKTELLSHECLPLDC
jgi:hypothetical protein